MLTPLGGITHRKQHPAAGDTAASGVLVGVGHRPDALQVARVSGVESLPVLHLLVVDSDDPVRNACVEIAQKMGFAVTDATDPQGASAILKHQRVDVLLVDLKPPGSAGLRLLEEVKTLYPETQVIVMTAFATVSSAVEAMKIGAGDYLTKPFALEELVSILESAGERRHFDLESRALRERLRTQRVDGHLIGRAPEMEKLYRIMSKVAHSNHPVLIAGEAGTGKELVARTIHFNGTHAAKTFVPVDCASLTPALVENELFGYVKGAFLGATRNAEGLLAGADGGTVFLDEVCELSLEVQGKLLRALQEKEVRPVGSRHALPLTARILASARRDLPALVEQGRFRRDLYFRLNVVNLRIPPLRDRREDIALLAMYFLERHQRETGRGYVFSDAVLRSMTEFDWPGNVRELESAIERACELSSGPVLHMGDLPTQLQEFRLQRRAQAEAPGTEVAQPERVVSIAEMEREAILGTIRQLNGDKLTAARLLGIGKTTLYRKLKEYGISEEGDTSH